MKKIFFVLILTLPIIFFACDSDSNFDSDSFIKDDAGNVFAKDFRPKKIISLAPNITETIYALGADSLLVGVTDFCDYPPEAKKKEKVGTLLDPNIEKITSLSPDLIIMTTEGNSKYTYLSLKSNGFKVFVTNPNDIAGINRMVIGIGTLSGKEENGKKIAERIMDSKKYYSLEKQNIQPVSSFLIISLNPLITANKFTYISELMDLAGLDNIYKDELIEYPNVNYEDVLLKNPECILYLCDTTKAVLLNQSISDIKTRLNVVNAVKNNKVFGVDENILSRPGPRVMEGVKLLRSKVF